MDAEQIELLYAAGSSLRSVGDKAGCCSTVVRRILVERGIQIRSHGGDHGGRKNWKGGRYVGSQGYVWIHESLVEPELQEMVLAGSGGRYVMEHRVVMARYLGRLLTEYEQVHHIDSDRSNNSLENLQLRIRSHGSGASFRCRGCGSIDIEAVQI